jgi:L-alanine-DL-glutamate epimerase-like enolase superfamily enzyme
MTPLRHLPDHPVTLASVEARAGEGIFFVRVRSADGAEGVAVTNERLGYLWPILEQRVAPCFLGRDARDLPALVEEVYTFAGNYKLSGLALWCCVAYVEHAVLDLLGKIAGLPVHALLGDAHTDRVPVYLSSLRRDTTPEQEVVWLGERLAETGARAVKVKIGGRMGANADAAPGRTERLISLARATFGPEVAIYTDANGGYDAARAIEVGRMLEAHGVGWLEEPCPWEDVDATQEVADALTLPVAGGEQDSGMARWQSMVWRRAVDVVQPDLFYNGGFLRCLRVAEIAAAAGLSVAPHSPKADATAAPMLHFAAVAPGLAPHMEWRGERPGQGTPGVHANFVVEDGAVAVPAGPGLGVPIDPDALARATPLF